MGKQKSYILVGSVFIGFIVLMLLVTIISNNVKKTIVTFDSDIYYVEVGKTRALTPTIYAGGKVVDDVTFTYESEDSTIFSVKPGTHSVGTALVDCWAFNEAKADGSVDAKTTITPYNEGDVVTVGDDLYWYVNGEKTRAKANKQYTQEEISKLVTKAPANIECFYLNGLPTNIPYDEDVTPVRNEETKTWFIDGKDTKVSYNSIPTTIEGLKLGSAKVTATGNIDGETFVLSATIKVCEPDPKGIKLYHIDDTIIINLNNEFVADYKVYADNELSDPLQAVTYTRPSGLTLNGEVFTATKAGNYRITVTVDEESFQLSVPKTLSTVLKVVVIDTTDEQIELIEAARIAIENIGTVDDSAECLARYITAKDAISKVSEEYSEYITNIKTFEKAQKKLENSNE